MYSEVKSENQILINRLNENEKILLESIYNKSQVENSKLSMSKLSDETGDFGGVLINLQEGEIPKIELNEATVKEVWLAIGESIDIEFNTNLSEDKIKILTYTDNNSIAIKSSKNVITINPVETQELSTGVLNYCIEADEYESYTGEITVHIIQRPLAKTYIKVTTKDDTETYIEDASYIVKDKDETQITPLEDGSYNLAVGSYSIEITHIDYITVQSTIKITNSDLLVASVTKILSVMEKKN